MNDLLLGKHILVVEDEMMILMMIEDILADMGCTAVHSASTVDQALALIETHRIDAATLDVNLHGADSYPIADVLGARGVPFAFITGYGSYGLRTDYHLHPTLRKPFHRQELDEMLERLLSGQTV